MIYLLVFYYAVTYSLIGYLLSKPMRVVYEKEGVKTPWNFHFGVNLFPILGLFISLIFLINDMREHIYQEEYRKYKSKKNQ